MIELLWALLIWALLVLVGAMRMYRGLHWQPSGTDPFEGRHIHVVASQADIDRLPCQESGCVFAEDLPPPSSLPPSSKEEPS
jgi:hypothetical protein